MILINILQKKKSARKSAEDYIYKHYYKRWTLNMNKEQLLKRKSEISELLSDETRSIDNLD
ncbi:hypothetical protein P4H76_32600, partial [Bacillus cereus]|nr:hypothetical protein [Bacillus cereus]